MANDEPSAQPNLLYSNPINVNQTLYCNLHQLGHGGSSTVFGATRANDNSFVAIKGIHTNQQCLANCKREIGILKRLQEDNLSKHLIQVIDSKDDVHDGRVWIVMEAGHLNLKQALKQWKEAKSLDKFTLMSHWSAMLQAVRYLHKARIIHGDIKPANFVFVGALLKLIDFGIAMEMNDDACIYRDRQVGTLDYMSPEALQFPKIQLGGCTSRKLKLGTASDVWSLGASLHEMVHGCPPFSQLHPIPKILAIVNPDHAIEYSEPRDRDLIAVLDMIRACLQRRAKDRPTIEQLSSSTLAFGKPTASLSNNKLSY